MTKTKKIRLVIFALVSPLFAVGPFLPLSFASAATYCPTCQDPVLYISKSVDRVSACSDEILTYTIFYQNIGNARATNVVISDDYNESYLEIYDSAGGAVSGGKIKWSIGTLNVGASGTKTFRAEIKNGAVIGTVYIDNKASINSNETSPVESNNVRVIWVNNCYSEPKVDIKANYSDGPITIPHDSSATLSWTSSNINSCYASGDWSGSKATSGSQSTGNLSYSKTYTITCTGSSGTVSDNVRVNVDEDISDVELKANPSSGCAPLKNVDLEADVSDSYGDSITYKFDCTNNGTWEKTITSDSNHYTAYDLCDYSSVGTYTAKVRAERYGYSSVEDTVKITVSDCEEEDHPVITKSVRNLTRGGSWSDSIYAQPNDMISFRIKIKAEDSYLNDVVVRDILPSGIVYRGNLQVDDRYKTGSITSGLDIGDISYDETKTVTFNAQVDLPSQFGYGQTQLTNTVYVSTDKGSDSDTVKIFVNRQTVAGVTTISTGLTNNLLLDSFILPLLIALVVIWLFKSRIINFEKWLDLKKERHQDYKLNKLLKSKIAQIKARESFRGE